MNVNLLRPRLGAPSKPPANPVDSHCATDLQENLFQIEGLLNKLYAEACTGSDEDFERAGRARATVLEAAQRGATFAVIDLPANYADELALLGFTCQPSAVTEAGQQDPAQNEPGAQLATALAASRHVLRDSDRLD